MTTDPSTSSNALSFSDFDTSRVVTDAEHEAQLRRAAPWFVRPFLTRELPRPIYSATEAMAAIFPVRQFPNATLPHPFVSWLRGRWWGLVTFMEQWAPRCPNGCGCAEWVCRDMYANDPSCGCLDYGEEE